jgi:DNA-directed RNA polymerase specialized sigma24 family protein
LLYLDFSQRESAELLGLTRGRIESTVRSIRLKMSDWQPPANYARLPGRIRR